MGVHHVQRQANRHARVDGIAAAFQDIETSHRSSGMARDDDAVGALNKGAKIGLRFHGARCQ